MCFAKASERRCLRKRKEECKLEEGEKQDREIDSLKHDEIMLKKLNCYWKINSPKEQKKKQMFSIPAT